MIVAEIKPYIIRTVSLSSQDVLTQSEAAHRVLSECVWIMLDHPAAWPKVVEALEIAPVALLSSMASILAAKRLPDGGWEWPITGWIATDGSMTKYGRATPSEAAVLERLFVWLNERLAQPGSSSASD